MTPEAGNTSLRSSINCSIQPRSSPGTFARIARARFAAASPAARIGFLRAASTS